MQLIAGGVAGVLAWLMVYPVDVVKSRLQAVGASASPYTGGTLQCARATLAEEGARVFVRGLGPTLGRAFIVNGAIFATFEAAMAVMQEPHSDHSVVAVAAVAAE